jgi:paraquat-inducible protein A
VLQAREVAVCTRCHATLLRGGDQRLAASRTAAAAMAAFILFWPGVLLPILEIERLGHRHASSILLGSIELLLHGSWFVGLIVLVFSIVFPLAKILLLLELSWLSWLRHRHKALTYRIMEHVSKWSMMDVMLLALLVMLVKLGNLVEFRLGPAVVAFVMCVLMSMVASMSFNPHSIWEHEP